MNMDRPLTDEQIWKRRARKAAPAVGFALAAGLAAAVLPGWVAPSLERRNLLISTVDAGPVEAGISGSGVIEPLTEHVLFSPVDAGVRRILRQPGDPVAPREVVFHLDVSHLRRDLEQQQGEIDLLANRRARTGTEHQQQMDDLQVKLRMTRLSADALAVKARQTRAVMEFGGVSKNALDEIELDRKRVSLELEQLQRQQTRLGAAFSSQLEAIELESAALQLEVDQLREDLAHGSLRSAVNGIVTRIGVEVGATVRKGSEIARIADLSAFRADVVVPDIHADLLAPQMPVRLVLSDNRELGGWIEHVFPTSESSAVHLDVRLKEPSHGALRPKMRVEAWIVTDRRARVTRLPRGPIPRDELGVRQAFVLRGESAVRTPVKLGLIGRNYFEVAAGLSVGDEVLAIDTQRFLQRERIAIE